MTKEGSFKIVNFPRPMLIFIYSMIVSVEPLLPGDRKARRPFVLSKRCQCREFFLNLAIVNNSEAYPFICFKLSRKYLNPLGFSQNLNDHVNSPYG